MIQTGEMRDSPANLNSLKEESPFKLAYLGDAYFELWCRQKVAFSDFVQGQNAKQTHSNVVQMVRCQTQSRLIHLLLPQLFPEELLIYKKGKNSKVLSPPKHAKIKEYRESTGFECLVGFFYMSQNLQRFEELMNSTKVVEYLESLIQIRVPSKVA